MQAVKRDDGRWYCRVFLGTIDGKKKYRHCYGATKKEAEAKARVVQNDIDSGVEVLTPETFGYWADFWLHSRKAETTPNQYDNDYSKANRIMMWSPAHQDWRDDKTALRHAKIADLKPFQLQGCLDSLAAENPTTGKPTAKKTLTDYRNVLQNICSYAQFNKAMVSDPSARLTIPKSALREQRRALSREEQQRIIEFDHRCRLAALLMMLCGLRRGEVTALTWGDVDLDSNVININKAYDFKQETVKPPKTESGVRTVPIPDILQPILRDARKAAKTVLVVTCAEGGQMNPTSWGRWLTGYLQDLNIEYGGFIQKPSKYAPTKAPMMIEPFTWHCLRHTYATILYDAGVDVLTAKKLLGHSDINTTLAIYTHLSKEKEELNICKLNEFLTPKQQSEESV